MNTNALLLILVSIVSANIVGLDMEAGDALFFHGRTIHGPYPNTTIDRWRSTFICQYVGKHATTFEPSEGTHVSHVNKLKRPLPTSSGSFQISIGHRPSAPWVIPIFKRPLSIA